MEKKKEILIFAVVLLGILVLILGGYVIYDKVLINKDKVSDNTVTDTETTELQVTTDDTCNCDEEKYKNTMTITNAQLMELYKEKLEYVFGNRYSLYDLNQDGVKELFVSTGDYAAEAAVLIYSYDEAIENKDKLILVGNIPSGHSNFFISNNNELIAMSAHMSFQSYTYFELDKNWLIRTKYTDSVEVEGTNYVNPPNATQLIFKDAKDLSGFQE